MILCYGLISHQLSFVKVKKKKNYDILTKNQNILSHDKLSINVIATTLSGVNIKKHRKL